VKKRVPVGGGWSDGVVTLFRLGIRASGGWVGHFGIKHSVNIWQSHSMLAPDVYNLHKVEIPIDGLTMGGIRHSHARYAAMEVKRAPIFYSHLDGRHRRLRCWASGSQECQ
jgi:hypothetical protein